jgi:uncharacterized membrane protein YkoI
MLLLFIARSAVLGHLVRMRNLLILASLLIPLSAPVAQSECLSQGEMREVVASSAVVAPAAATRAAQAQSPGAEVTRVQLCRAGGGYVFEITLLQRDGRLVSVTVDASTGQLR